MYFTEIAGNPGFGRRKSKDKDAFSGILVRRKRVEVVRPNVLSLTYRGYFCRLTCLVTSKQFHFRISPTRPRIRSLSTKKKKKKESKEKKVKRKVGLKADALNASYFRLLYFDHAKREKDR